MKYRVKSTSKFRKDLKLTVKRGNDIETLKTIIYDLANDEELDQRFNNHKLKGKYAGLYECHITSDLLLIYRITDNELILSRLGTHSDLFI